MIWVNYFGSVSHLRYYLHPMWWLSRAIVFLPLTSIDTIKPCEQLFKSEQSWACASAQRPAMVSRGLLEECEQKKASALWHLPWLLDCTSVSSFWPAARLFIVTTLCDSERHYFNFHYMKKSTTLFGFQPAARYLHLVPCWTC